MQTIVTLDWSRSVANEVVGATPSTSNHGANLPVSKVYEEQVHHLFNYGMNACDDRVLVKNCIVEWFFLVGARPDLLAQGESVVTNIFKVFRRLLIQQIASRGQRSISDLHTNLFPAETEKTRGLTSLQQEALFLKFQRRLTYREVANIMDLPIEQLRGQISKAVGNLVREK